MAPSKRPPPRRPALVTAQDSKHDSENEDIATHLHETTSVVSLLSDEEHTVPHVAKRDAESGSEEDSEVSIPAQRKETVTHQGLLQGEFYQSVYSCHKHWRCLSEYTPPMQLGYYVVEVTHTIYIYGVVSAYYSDHTLHTTCSSPKTIITLTTPLHTKHCVTAILLRVGVLTQLHCLIDLSADKLPS